MKTTIQTFLVFAAFAANTHIGIAQTPYDDFAPNSKKREMLKLPERAFKAYSNDTASKIKYIKLNKETYVLSYYDKNDSVIETFALNATDKKWMSVDPLAKKYPQYSPYNFVDGNPIRSIDIDGSDIIVLNNPNGASGYGHMAVLIGNDKTGWTFVSKEGRDKTAWYSNELTGGPALKPLIGVYTNLDAFKKAQESDANLGAYSQNVRLTATSTQDKTALNTTQKAATSWYNVGFSNCADAVSDGLKAAGFDPGYKTVGVSVDDNPFSSVDPIKSLSPQPTQRFNEIAKNNQAQSVPTFPTATPATDASASPASTTPTTPAVPTPATPTKKTAGGN